MTRRRIFLYASIALLCILLCSFIGYAVATGNFHVVTPGEAYRSAQLDQSQLDYYIGRYRIRSILNLRGKHPEAPWYTDEVRFSGTHKIAHYDIAMSATREPTATEISSLMRVFAQAPRPILIHCYAGADRSGLASAIWKVVVDHQTKANARQQLSILYGHIPLGKTAAMDSFFEQWSPARDEIIP
ncbi:MAG: dual specificity protein phosphatase family protein [Nitrospirae bacterium]|nr:dual specificity protein phosphatase family protein [Nitrospirota bacterium]